MDCGSYSLGCELRVRFVQLNPHAAAVEAQAGNGGRSAAEKGVEDEVAGVGRGQQAAFDERNGFLGGMLAVRFFVVARCA